MMQKRNVICLIDIMLIKLYFDKAHENYYILQLPPQRRRSEAFIATNKINLQSPSKQHAKVNL